MIKHMMYLIAAYTDYKKVQCTYVVCGRLRSIGQPEHSGVKTGGPYSGKPNGKVLKGE